MPIVITGFFIIINLVRRRSFFGCLRAQVGQDASAVRLSIYLYLLHNKPYSTAKRKDSETGRTRLTALTAALRNGKIKTKVVTTSTSK